MIKRITEIGVVVKSITGSGDRLHEILGARGGTVLKAQEYGMVAQKHLPFISQWLLGIRLTLRVFFLAPF